MSSSRTYHLAAGARRPDASPLEDILDGAEAFLASLEVPALDAPPDIAPSEAIPRTTLNF